MLRFHTIIPQLERLHGRTAQYLASLRPSTSCIATTFVRLRRNMLQNTLLTKSCLPDIQTHLTAAGILERWLLVQHHFFLNAFQHPLLRHYEIQKLNAALGR